MPRRRGRRWRRARGPGCRGGPGTEPPAARVASTSTAASRSRSSRGGGKYSSSSVMRTSSTPSRGASGRITLSTSVLRGRRAGGDPDRAGEVVGELVGAVDPEHPRGAGLAGQALERPGVGGVGRADHDHGVAALRDGAEGGLAVGGGEAQVAAAGPPQGREPLGGAVRDRGPVAVAQRGLGQQRHVVAEVGEGIDLRDGLDAVDRRRGPPPSCPPPPRGPRGPRRRSGSPCRPAPSPRGGPWSRAGTRRRPRTRRWPGPPPRPRGPSRGPTA